LRLVEAKPADITAADKPRDLNRLAVWIVLVVGILAIGDLLMVRTGHPLTAIFVGLLACVFLALAITNRRSAPPPPTAPPGDKPA
jgi:hypothetical protein